MVHVIKGLQRTFERRRSGARPVLAAALLSVGLAQPALAVVFQAEDYSAFHDTTPGNTGGAYRNDDVDIQPTTDTGGGFNVGWIEAGEWLAFNNLSIPTTGSYTIRFRVASPNGGTISADLNAGSIVLGSWAVPNTGGWQTWQTLSKTVTINAGTYNLGVFATTGGWNLNWVEVVPNAPSAPVTLFQNCNFGGTSAGLQVGRYTLSQLQALGVRNDDISSLRVASGFRVTLFQNDNFTGTSTVKTADDSCLVDDAFNDMTTSVVVESTGSGPPGTANGTHKRLKFVNGCGQDIWIQWLTAPTVTFSGGANRARLAGMGSSVEYSIPDKGLPAMRFWPGFGCDATGHNCRVGSSGGPASLGFSCPPEGCAPPIDSKFEASFGCIPGVADADCAPNPSAPGQVLGRGDWWNSSMVDGYTVPIKVQVHGVCPVGPQPAPVFGPGGPPNGVIDCSGLRVFECPTNENLSTDGQFPQLSSVSLVASNPASHATVGCYSPSGKLTFSQWANGFQTFAPNAPQAQMYSCPTPPVTPQQCSAGPANRTTYRNMIHSHCATYAYPYDDGFGLATCPAATNLSYEVTFFCPE
jgi:hypothetical protein